MDVLLTVLFTTAVGAGVGVGTLLLFLSFVLMFMDVGRARWSDRVIVYGVRVFWVTALSFVFGYIILHSQ